MTAIRLDEAESMNVEQRGHNYRLCPLYCVTPLGKINPSNKVIQQVTEIIPHSVASIVMRMRNFRYIDPKRFLQGSKNVAKADRMIYEEFKHD